MLQSVICRWGESWRDGCFDVSHNSQTFRQVSGTERSLAVANAQLTKTNTQGAPASLLLFRALFVPATRTSSIPCALHSTLLHIAH